MRHARGYTLVELVIAVGLFALVMLLSSGAYLMMIGLNRQAQTITVGINNLSFAIESMTRSIRTGSGYSCGGLGDCPSGAGSFSFTNENGIGVSYSAVASTLIQTVGGVQSALTDPASVTISNLTFYASGTQNTSGSDYHQPHVTIIVSGTVKGKVPQSFTIETGATMRGSDI